VSFAAAAAPPPAVVVVAVAAPGTWAISWDGTQRPCKPETESRR